MVEPAVSAGRPRPCLAPGAVGVHVQDLGVERTLLQRDVYPICRRQRRRVSQDLTRAGRPHYSIAPAQGVRRAQGPEAHLESCGPLGPDVHFADEPHVRVFEQAVHPLPERVDIGAAPDAPRPEIAHVLLGRVEPACQPEVHALAVGADPRAQLPRVGHGHLGGGRGGGRSQVGRQVDYGVVGLVAYGADDRSAAGEYGTGHAFVIEREQVFE